MENKIKQILISLMVCVVIGPGYRATRLATLGRTRIGNQKPAQGPVKPGAEENNRPNRAGIYASPRRRPVAGGPLDPSQTTKGERRTGSNRASTATKATKSEPGNPLGVKENATPNKAGTTSTAIVVAANTQSAAEAGAVADAPSLAIKDAAKAENDPLPEPIKVDNVVTEEPNAIVAEVNQEPAPLEVPAKTDKETDNIVTVPKKETTLAIPKETPDGSTVEEIQVEELGTADGVDGKYRKQKVSVKFREKSGSEVKVFSAEFFPQGDIPNITPRTKDYIAAVIMASSLVPVKSLRWFIQSSLGGISPETENAINTVSIPHGVGLRLGADFYISFSTYKDGWTQVKLHGSDNSNYEATLPFSIEGNIKAEVVASCIMAQNRVPGNKLIEFMEANNVAQSEVESLITEKEAESLVPQQKEIHFLSKYKGMYIVIERRDTTKPKARLVLKDRDMGPLEIGSLNPDGKEWEMLAALIMATHKASYEQLNEFIRMYGISQDGLNEFGGKVGVAVRFLDDSCYVAYQKQPLLDMYTIHSSLDHSPYRMSCETKKLKLEDFFNLDEEGLKLLAVLGMLINSKSIKRSKDDNTKLMEHYAEIKKYMDKNNIREEKLGKFIAEHFPGLVIPSPEERNQSRVVPINYGQSTGTK